MKGTVVIICIVIPAAFSISFFLSLVACSRDIDEQSRKMEDEEQVEYIQHWLQKRAERRKKKKK